jgi:DNA-binding IclR family transcriptional regulator
VFDNLGHVEAALGLSGTISQVDDTNIPRLVGLLKEAARKISRQLGRMAPASLA